jgi:hypothetical protein
VTTPLHETLFNAIAHGDEKHRAWLKQAIDDHFAGRPVLRPDETSSTVETTPARSEAIQRRADAVANSCKVCGFMFGDHAPACSAVNTKVVTCEHVPRGYACEFCNHDGGPL